MHEQPEISALSDAAFRLHYSAREYASHNLTDGYVPFDQPARLVRMRRPKGTVLELLEAKLWHEAARPCAACVAQRAAAAAIAPAAHDGYLIHGYLDDQPPRHKVLAARAAARRRMDLVRGGERSPEQPPERSRERSPDVRAPRTPGYGSTRSVGYGGPERSPDVRPNVRANSTDLRPAGVIAERLQLGLAST